MHGIQRLPALWYDYPNHSMEELNLSHYEILPNEPLHDVSNYIKNIYQELPSHMTNNEKKIVTEVIDKSFNVKEARNSSDYRKSLLVVCAFFIERFPGTYYTEILKTLTEIQELLYLPEKERSTTKILRFYNTTFQHTLLLKRHFENNLKVLTARKFYGVYYHSLMTHAREQYRIVSGRSANSEREEALFTSMKNNTNQTSNHHPNKIISNILIRHQAKNKIDNSTSVERKTSYIHNIYDSIKNTPKNSVIPFKLIEDYPYEYQSHLEGISDYLLDQTKWWEETDHGVMFYDIENNQTNEATKLKIHHFRSYSLKEEWERTRKLWEKCISSKDLIPAKKMKYFDENGTKVIVTLTTLNHFQVNEKDKSNNLLNPQPETEDLINNSHISLSEYDTIQPSTINTSNNSPSTPVLYQEYQTKLTGDDTSESIYNISSILESDKTQLPKSTDATKYQPIPLSSTPVKNMCQSKEQVDSSSIIEFKLQPPSTKSDQSKNQLSSSSRMLQALNIAANLVENYDKVRKQLKKQNFVNYNEYKVIIAKLEVKLYSIEDILLKELSQLEKFILMGNNALNVVPERNCDTKKYNDISLKLKYIKILKKDIRIKS